LEKGLTLAENVLKHGTGGLNIDACRFAYGDPCWVGPSEMPEEISGGDRLGTVGHAVTMSPIDYSGHQHGRWPANIYQCPKASRSEREAGLEHLQGKSGFEAVDRNEGTAGLDNPRAGAGRTADQVKNFHPTVKPIGVMRWLCRLITPPGGTVLDPFLGSGTTAVSACLEGKFNAIGCEMTEDYWPIIEGRIEWAKREREDGPKE
jgi:site-specific DNA-methyltransferase (adenine-specific)